MPGPALFILSCLFAMGIAAVGGLLIGVPCLRLRGDYLAIATLGFGEIVRIAIQNTDPNVLGGSLGLTVPRVLMKVTRKTKGDFRILFVVIGFALVALVAIAIRNYIKSAQAAGPCSPSPRTRRRRGSSGINGTGAKMTAFVIGLDPSRASPVPCTRTTRAPSRRTTSCFMEMVKIFLIVVLGGLGSISGCILAAFLLLYRRAEPRQAAGERRRLGEGLVAGRVRG